MCVSLCVCGQGYVCVSQRGCVCGAGWACLGVCVARAMCVYGQYLRLCGWQAGAVCEWQAGGVCV